jgi:HEAT repeat protein
MPEVAKVAPLAPDIATRLAAFARACKAAARAVSLYPPEHPAIEASLGRLAIAATAATEKGSFAVQVAPNQLLVDGKAAARPDPAIADLAVILHDHLVGELTVHQTVDSGSWRTFLALLALDPRDVRAQGGIERAWKTAGGHGIDLQEIDYSSLLQERETGETATWDRIIANSLRSDALELDEETLRALTEIASDASRFSDFVTHFEEETNEKGDVRSRSAALLRILKGIAKHVGQSNPQNMDLILDSMAQAATRLSPEVMLQLLGEARTPGSEEAHVVGEMTLRMSDPMIARFVARSVATERGCTTRLAEAFRSLAQNAERQKAIAGLTRQELKYSVLGGTPEFYTLWSHVEHLLLSYSDHAFVSEEYNIELSNVRAQAFEVERVPDDPPERISRWLTTVSDAALRALDIQLLCDLLVVEPDGNRWQELLDVVVRHVDDLVLIADFVSARRLVDALAAQTKQEDPYRQRSATNAIAHLVKGELMTQLATHLNTVGEEEVAQAQRLCLAIGPTLIPQLANALATEQRARSRQRLTDLLLEFGEHGRQCVDQLRRSPNPSVRRTAVQLLRTFGGEDALSDLKELLNDDEAHVQREAVRALIAIAVDEGYAMLEEALASEENKARASVIQELSTTRDDRATPLFCYMLRRLECRGATREIYLKSVSRLGQLGGPAAIETLTEVLNKGLWWAPHRAKEWRTEAAAALALIATPQSMFALEEAAARGSFGVRRIARKYVTAAIT